MYHKIQDLAKLVVDNLTKVQKGAVWHDICAKWADIVSNNDILKHGAVPLAIRQLNETEPILVLACSHGAIAMYVASHKKFLIAQIVDMSGHFVADVTCAVNTKYFISRSGMLEWNTRHRPGRL